jgi:hypothetical protein
VFPRGLVFSAIDELAARLPHDAVGVLAVARAVHGSADRKRSASMNLFRFESVAVVATLALAVPHAAIAQENRAPMMAGAQRTGPAIVFGQTGHLAISSDAGLFISNTSISGQDGSTTTIQLRPAVDYFIVDNLSLGGFLGFDYTNQAGDSGHTTSFSIGPRVGFDIVLTELFTVWPKVGLSYAHTSINQTVPTTTTVNGVPVTTSTSVSESSNALALNLFVPFMLHPAEHFFIGFGPAFDVDLTGDNKATIIAGRLTLGGWI